MTKVIVTPINDVFLHVSTEPHVAYELSDRFSFRIPNAHFHPKVKARLWDGRIKLYRNSRIYIGLLEDIKTFCKTRDYEFVYQSNQNILHPKIKTDITWNLPDNIEVRDYQKSMILHAIENERILMLSPTSSGKSLIIYSIIKHIIESNDSEKGLIIVPRLSLVKQLYTDFQSYSTKNKWNVDENIHMVFSGQDHNSDKKIIISTWQSIYKNPVEYFKQFSFVVGDECHEFKATSLVSIMEKLVNARIRIGTTGTLDGIECNEMTLIGLFGPKVVATTTKTLQDQKHIATLKINCIILEHPHARRERFKYIDEINYLTGNNKRNQYITNLSLSLKGNTLVLYRYIENHGQILHDIFKEKIADKYKNKKIYYIHGGVDADIREEIRKIVNEETNSIILASIGTFAMGVNIPNLHNIVFAAPTKSRIKTLQSIGRVLRLSKDKTNAVLYDIADDMRKGKYTNHTFKHFYERIKLYSVEDFDYKVFTVKINEE